ncbi:unextended protein isoform X1 [Anopheles moucheti]|uniref:unextended protein isoform X1 n=1 Tax=Anopheles moucheti TaxID=186751 RepID=UPI0022F046D7|nr:unextended protein isoform X1 [Anopheles moucheti]
MARSGRWEMLKIITHLTLILLSGDTWHPVESRSVGTQEPGPASPDVQPNAVAIPRVEIVAALADTGDKLLLYTVGNGRSFVVDRRQMECHEQVHVYETLLPPELTAVSKEDEQYLRSGDIPCWSAQGSPVMIVLKDGVEMQPNHGNDRTHNTATRKKRNIPGGIGTNSFKTMNAERSGTNDQKELRIEGFRIEHADVAPEMVDGVTSVRVNSPVKVRLFGRAITPDTVIVFTHEPSRFLGSCQIPVTEKFRVMNVEDSGRSALVEIELPEVIKNKKYFYMCAKYESTDALERSEENEKEATKDTPFLHQGLDSWMRLTTNKPFLPFWLSIMVIGFCLMFSALFSGLNLGLMSLDRTDLKILCNTGSDKEKQYANAIKPVRDMGNYLLCSILLGNVLVNSTFTILLDSLTSGLFAIVGSTIAIVIFGEITPQAICSRHGLAVGAKTILITKAVMVLTFPLSYPTSKILDFLLGKEIGNFYDRERLKELVKVTNDVNDLDKDEVNVIAGVLELRKKTVQQVMTRLEDAYMLSIDDTLDFEKIAEIMQSGYSRIPVYDGENREEILSILHSKDLAFIDPDDNTPIRQMCEFYMNRLHYVFYDQTLDVMFKEFKTGAFGHMAFVHRVNADGDGDPFYEIIGLITMEDVLEELIQAEIIDETDVYTDNKNKIRRKGIKRPDIPTFVHRPADTDEQRLRIGPQLMFATYQYISTAVPAFKRVVMSETMLRRLLNQNIYHQIKIKSKDRKDRVDIINRGTPIDYFVLILEGRVEVTVGKEDLLFESGPFTHFGLQAIVQSASNEQPLNTQQEILGSLESINRDESIRENFTPDYTVQAITDVLYMQIPRKLYLDAKRATLRERSQKLGDQSMDPIDPEVEQLMHSLEKGDQNSMTVNSGAPASKSSSDVASPTTALNEQEHRLHIQKTRELSLGTPNRIPAVSHCCQSHNPRCSSLCCTTLQCTVPSAHPPIHELHHHYQNQHRNHCSIDRSVSSDCWMTC